MRKGGLKHPPPPVYCNMSTLIMLPANLILKYFFDIQLNGNFSILVGGERREGELN